jgi:hypothetical protein
MTVLFAWRFPGRKKKNTIAFVCVSISVIRFAASPHLFLYPSTDNKRDDETFHIEKHQMIPSSSFRFSLVLLCVDAALSSPVLYRK